MKLLQLSQKSSVCVPEKSTGKAQSIDNQKPTKSFWHLRTYPNPEYQSGLKIVPLRSCLLHNNVNTNNWVIKTKPKWNTDLLESHLDKETGEITHQGVYTTNDLKSANNRKIKAMNRFCDKYQPLYLRHQVSIFFYTLTLANQSNTDIRHLLNSFKTRLKRNGINLRGYVWVLEISETLHVHYHALVCTDRIQIKGKQMPDIFKLDSLWGCRTQVRFAKRYIRGYLAKYFVKASSRILNKRSYGISAK